MGGKGPEKTPTAVLKKRGSWLAPVREKTEPHPSPGIPICPDMLKGPAKQEWNKMVRLLNAAGILTKVDGRALARYCRHWVAWVELAGDESLDPDYKRLDKQIRISEHLLKFEVQYGMTPASRPNIKRLEKPAHGNAGAKDKSRFFQAG